MLFYFTADCSFVAQLSKFAFQEAGWVLPHQFELFQGFSLKSLIS